jgi:AcrR family transcriptional regulator
MNKARSAGRRSGQPDTRAKILDAARKRFTEVGYGGATMRAIAAEAGVDAALISYFFGSKEGLFGAAFELRTNPAVVITEQLDGPIDELPRRLVTVLIDTWDDPNNRATLLAIAKAGATPETAGLTRGFVEGVLLAPVAERLRGAGLTKSDANRCSALLATQLVGVIYARYVLAVDAVAAMSRKDFLDYYSIGLTAVLDAFTRRANGT